MPPLSRQATPEYPSFTLRRLICVWEAQDGHAPAEALGDTLSHSSLVGVSEAPGTLHFSILSV